jgi:DNA-binding NarL/FixJ family response regulator
VSPVDARYLPAAVCAADRSVTPRQLAVLRAHVATGSYRCAAYQLGISYRTVRSHLVAVRLRLGVDTTEQAVYVLTARGVLVVPEVGRRTA